MKIVDLNILLYSVNRDSAHYGSMRRWWEAAVNGDEPVGLTWITLLGFLRLSTNARIFPQPLPIGEAISKIDRWLEHPNVRLLIETDEQWRILRHLLEETGAGGNLTTDAHLAAIAISHGATLFSCDADFSRFRSLRYENPLSE